MRLGAIVLALCMVATATVAQAPSGPQGTAHEEQQNAQRPDAHNSEAKPSNWPPAPAERHTEPSQPRTEQQERQEGDEAGYLARIKRWVVALVGFADRNDKSIVAVGTIFIAAFTVILGIATVFLWLATKKLVEGADMTSRRQLRAYISIDQSGFTRQENVAWYHVGFKNFGATPASNVRLSCNSDLRLPNDDRPFPAPNLSKAYGSIATSQVFVIGSDEDRAFTDEEWQDIYAGRKIIFLFGRAVYIDCFGKERETCYKMKTNGQLESARRGLFQMCEDGNEAT